MFPHKSIPAKSEKILPNGKIHDFVTDNRKKNIVDYTTGAFIGKTMRIEMKGFLSHWVFSAYNCPMIVIVGASATGKTDTALLLRKKYGVMKAVTHTTRAPRQGEIPDVSYHFVTKGQFERLIANGKLVEYTNYNGNYYGCSKAEISDGKCVIVDPNGLKAFLALKDERIVSFLLLANGKTRAKRMKERGDSDECIKRRLAGDRIDFDPKQIGPVDFKIKTDHLTLEEVADAIYEKYNAELIKRGISE